MLPILLYAFLFILPNQNHVNYHALLTHVPSPRPIIHEIAQTTEVAKPLPEKALEHIPQKALAVVYNTNGHQKVNEQNHTRPTPTPSVEPTATPSPTNAPVETKPPLPTHPGRPKPTPEVCIMIYPSPCGPSPVPTPIATELPLPSVEPTHIPLPTHNPDPCSQPPYEKPGDPRLMRPMIMPC